MNTWEDLPTRDSAQSTGYKLEWSRWSQMRVTDFLPWQAALVRQYRRPDQFVTTDFAAAMRRDVNEEAVAGVLDIPAINIYHGTQDHFDGAQQVLAGGLCPLAAGIEFPGDGDQRANHGLDFGLSNFRPTTASCARTFTPISPTAPTWWSTGTGPRFAANQETYWKGVLSHDLEPNRAYAEVTRTAHELEKIGPHLVGLKITTTSPSCGAATR